MEQETKLKCVICKKEFKKFSELSQHIRRYEKKIVKEYYDNYIKKDDEEICLGLNCGKETKFNGLEKGYAKFCSYKCSANNKNTRNKCKNTNLKNYGYDNPFKSPDIKNQIKQTLLKKFNVENAAQSKKVQKKMKQTNLKKFGVENASQSSEIKKRKIQTNLKHFNTEYPMQNRKVLEKYKQTNLKNLGVENPSQSKEIKKLKKQTNLKNRGVENPSQSKEIKKKKIQTSQKNCGFDYWTQTEQGKQFHRERFIKNIEVREFYNGRSFCPFISDNEPPCLDFLEKISNCYIDRQPNIGGFFPDGRILHLMLIIEFDEPFHYINGYSKDDLDRENYLKSQGYIIFRIKQIDWKQNQKKVLEEFKFLVQNLSEEYIKSKGVV